MKLFDILSVAALSLLIGACATTSPSDKASKQAEIRQAAQQSLDKFYKADPKLQSAVANAPGYAVFTTYGLSFVVGGSGGAGLVHNNRPRPTRSWTWRKRARACRSGPRRATR